MLSNNLTQAEVLQAKVFIEKLIEHYKNIYAPTSLFNDNPHLMTKQVVTHDLINRQIKELEDLLRPKENIDNGQISALQRKYQSTKFRK